MMSETRYRNRYDITKDILGLLSEEPKIMTKVMYGCNLSYAQLVAYREELLAKGLITINSETGHWQVTQKGIEKLRALREACA